MNDMDKLLDILEEANLAYDAAVAGGDAASASAIESETIFPIKQALAGIAMGGLQNTARIMNDFSAKLEIGLRNLQRRIDRMFVDRLVEKARDLGLVNVPVEPRPVGSEATGMPEPGSRATNGSTSVVPPATGRNALGGVTTIEVTDRDLDALARVANSEVGHFGKYGQGELEGGVRAVVDTILNRVAHSRFKNSVEEVVDQPKQFSAINDIGTWSRLPVAPANVMMIVRDHLLARASGAASEVEGATHFLNPHVSSAGALSDWGDFVRDNAIASYGRDDEGDVHFHGYAPGYKQPEPYALVFGSVRTVFSGVGEAEGGTPSTNRFRDALIDNCRAELEYFNNGKSTETDHPQYLRVGDYWNVLGIPNNGRTVGADGNRPAWSAAFISFILRESGAGNRFPYSQAHCHYFQHFVDQPTRSLFEAVSVEEHSPVPGDMLHFGRSYAGEYNFSVAKSTYSNDSFYPSHCTIVVAVETDTKKIFAIGGNESDSVRMAEYELDDNLRLKKRTAGNKKLPWIGILRLV